MNVFLAVVKDLFDFAWMRLFGSYAFVTTNTQSEPLSLSSQGVHREALKPRVGIGVVIRKEGKILLGLRKNAHGSDTWSPPGGHLEFMETIEECAVRETTEETSLSIKNIKRPVFTEEFHREENKHYINLMTTADWQSGEPELREPDKCDRWEWFAWDALPSPLFLPLQNHINQGYNPFSL